MALGYHNYHGSNDESGNPPVSSSPGLSARVNQVKAANAEVESVRAENAGRGTTGMVAARKQREVAEHGLERQIRYQRGQYPVR